jgi:hypothetical protein
MGRARAGRSDTDCIEIEELHDGGLHALFHDAAESFEELVAKVMVGFALCPKTLRIEREGTRQVKSPRIKMPFVGRNEPRPSKDVAIGKRLNGNRAAIGADDFDPDPPLANEVELMRFLALSKYVTPRIESDIGSTSGDQGEMVFRQIFEKGMLSQYGFEVLHETSYDDDFD